MKLRGGLRREKSKNYSGKLKNKNKIICLKEENYIISNILLDGNAPKQLAHIYFYEKGGRIKKAHPKTWDKYIVKTAEKWYPLESVIEYMINRIGQILGVKMNEILLIRANGQIRFASKYFLSRNETLIHGAEMCGEYLDDREFAQQIAGDKKEARNLFTYSFLREAIEFVFPAQKEEILKGLVTMIFFDAIVGNNDRHFYNWGVIRSSKISYIKPIFSPVYDSARGLFWNVRNDEVGGYLQHESKLESYIKKSFPRISIEANKEANHFEVVQHIIRKQSCYKKILDNMCSFDSEIRVLYMLEKELFPLIFVDRAQAIAKVLQTRFDRLRKL